MIHQIGFPKQREKKYRRPYVKVKENIPKAVFEELAEAVASLRWDEAQRDYGISPQIIRSCKMGFVPDFQMSTLSRFYPEFVWKPFIW